MSFPGFPPMGGAGAGANAGMSEQEQNMIKMVCITFDLGIVISLQY